MSSLEILLLLVTFFTVTTCVTFPTPLQTYVSTPDSTYQYELASTIVRADTTVYFVRLTSQKWLTPEDTSVFIWQHWLRVIVPHNLTASTQTGIYVDGGEDSIDPPQDNLVIGDMIAVQSQMIMGHLFQIPNEPAYFYSEGCCKRRTEDAEIAYGWSHFINDTTKPEWLLRFPMVKSVVRAMDAMQDFLPKIGQIKPEKFVIAGASKRGWTTWLLPAVDSRVNAIVPMVMPILNMVNVINQMWRSLGVWSFTLDDYYSMNIMQDLNLDSFRAMSDIIDPVVYMDYLEKVPKYMVFSTGDEFFLPDSARNFYDDLRGDTYLRMAPNTEHSLAPLDALIVSNIATFVSYIKFGDPIPSIKEKIVYSNTTATITVFPSHPPDEAKLWIAPTVSKTRRDFRLIICGQIPACFQPVFWFPESLKPNADGSYSASVSAPSNGGWNGFVIELAYKSKYVPDNWYQVTSQVVIVPDVYPFPPCGSMCGKNSTIIKK